MSGYTCRQELRADADNWNRIRAPDFHIIRQMLYLLSSLTRTLPILFSELPTESELSHYLDIWKPSTRAVFGS
ncbi:hypothetical protein RRG08_050824 [Elysia crispata]|uniref:Uncharacterized protein n=1 Tax=Elysia crispata TaxID=231223 RepID=A0AAE1DWR1_9GAST|nr:hypothetical protein RRG08_050824 [Elysia crispata]